jgi:hypothetical protein
VDINREKTLITEPLKPAPKTATVRAIRTSIIAYSTVVTPRSLFFFGIKVLSLSILTPPDAFFP